jgi:hypothetical protein
VTADAGRLLPHTLPRVDTGDGILTDLRVLIGFEDDQPPRGEPGCEPDPPLLT